MIKLIKTKKTRQAYTYSHKSHLLTLVTDMAAHIHVYMLGKMEDHGILDGY